MAMHTYGLSGLGMDVNQLVKDLMPAHWEQYDKVWQKNGSYDDFGRATDYGRHRERQAGNS